MMGSARRRRRGIALLTSMIVCLFLVMLTGALIQNQSASFSISQTSDASIRARAACQTVYDYCLYQLEHNRNWGSGAGFASLQEIDPERRDNSASSNLDVRVKIREFSGRVLRGYLPEQSCSFEVTVNNTLTLPAASPQEQVTLEITTWDGDVAKKASRSVQGVHCRLRLAPLYDASILSRGRVTVEAEEALFASKDAFRNEVRAEGGVTLPGLTQGKTRFVKYQDNLANKGLAQLTPDSTGMLWSGDKISEVTGPNADPLALESDGLQAAARLSSARMVDEASNRADIYDLKPENIPQPEHLRKITVPPGEFRFTKANAVVTYDETVTVTDSEGNTTTTKVRKSNTEAVDVLEYFDPPIKPGEPPRRPLKVLRANTRPMAPNQEQISVRVNYGESGIVAEVGDRFELDFSNQGSTTVTDENGNTQPQGQMGFRRIGEDASAPVLIDLRSQTVAIAPGTKVTPASRPSGSSLPPSSFELTTREGTGGIPELPTFQLGSGNSDVVFEADGDVSIGVGYTKGLGTVISKTGNVTLNPIPPRFTSWVDISANDRYAGLVVYADRDVRIGNITDASWNVRGFVYARRNFYFDVNNQNATFFGSVVAGNVENGNFRIKNGKRATFIYDPEYLKLMTRQLGNGWTRLEPLIWSESRG